MKNMPPAALEGPMAQQQKMLMYVFPLIFAFSGVNFPIGVLIYWTTTNLWSMGQQFYTIRRMPAPGSQAEAALKARQAKKASHKGVSIEESDTLTIEEKPVSGQRQQPVGKARAKKQRPAGAAGAATGTATGAASGATGGAPKAAASSGSGTAAGAKGGAPKASGAGSSGSGSAQGGKPAGGGTGSGQASAGKKKRSGTGQGAGGSAQRRPGSTPSGSATDD
jgi:YidC/Oxa1 family membrane protein insertase